MNKKYAFYYSLLFLSILVMSAYTIVIGSQNVSYGQRIADLQNEEKAIVAHKQALQQNTAQAVSMSHLSQTASAQGYVPMHDLIQLHHSDVVASR